MPSRKSRASEPEVECGEACVFKIMIQASLFHSFGLSTRPLKPYGSSTLAREAASVRAPCRTFSHSLARLPSFRLIGILTVRCGMKIVLLETPAPYVRLGDVHASCFPALVPKNDPVPEGQG